MCYIAFWYNLFALCLQIVWDLFIGDKAGMMHKLFALCQAIVSMIIGFEFLMNEIKIDQRLNKSWFVISIEWTERLEP